MLSINYQISPEVSFFIAPATDASKGIPVCGFRPLVKVKLISSQKICALNIA